MLSPFGPRFLRPAGTQWRRGRGRKDIKGHYAFASSTNPLPMDSSPNFADHQSQLSASYTTPQGHRSYEDYGFEERSSDPHSDGSHTADLSDDSSVLVDLLANNYKLDIELRNDLHSFLDVVQSLPPVQLKMAIILQATALCNQQVINKCCWTSRTNVQQSIISRQKSTSPSLRTPRLPRNKWHSSSLGVGMNSATRISKLQ
ncbi:hypothetical protein B0H19DRAFT_151426 [Mycena capillaripes]|nr:hypothetical protein B0H19DRAFT_151426 [Mycena capillaripes]